MKFRTWTCGTLAGIVATICLMVISLSLFFLNLIPISISEYGARFMLNIDNKSMHTGRWIIGILTNFSLGGLFGLISAYTYKVTGLDESVIKSLGIAVALWFFQLAIVPVLNHDMMKYSTYDTAIAYFAIYIVWGFVASAFIKHYLSFQESDSVTKNM